MLYPAAPDRHPRGDRDPSAEIGHISMDERRRTVRDLRRHNRATLLATLFFDGPLSRLELARLTGLSPATVSNVTGELVDERLVVEAGLADSDGGRPRVLLRVNPGYGHVVGVDVGEASVKAELFDLAMRRLSTVDEPVFGPWTDPGAIAAQVGSALRHLIGEAGIEERSVLGIGIGVPGTVQRNAPREGTPQSGERAGLLVHAQVVGWEAVPFEELLRGCGVRPPVFVDNGAKTQGQAELWFGAGRGARHVVVALVGSGVGATVITDGDTYQGATSSAGEWGHTTIMYGGRRCRCGGRGCLEAYVGAGAILERYRRSTGRPTPTGGGQPSPDERSALAALLAAAPRSRAASRVLAETAGYLGAGIANLINLFNPERIVLGGWAGLALGTAMLPQIRAAAAEQALRHPYRQTTIELCELGPDAVAVGAATLPVAALLARGGDHRESRRPAA
jgi:predicted NBD/HSP70 family sugar kinase